MVSKSNKRVLDFAFPMLEALDTARSLSWAIALRYGYDSVLDVLELPMHFGPFPEDRIRREYESYMLLRKMPDIFGTDLEQVALEAFLKAEQQCKVVNDIGFAQNRLSPDGALEHRITRVLADLLGSVPSLNELSRLASWGPGATYDLSRKYASPELKTIRENGITLGLLRALQDEDLSGFLYPTSFSLTPGGRITTVPKNVKTNRTIMVEPGVNAFFQNGLGTFIRQILGKFGIDLRRAADKHRVRCLIDWRNIATIDLAAASDTISAWLLTLLPLPWFRLIETLRSPFACLPDGTWIELQKVSSMGNGFTFELESLIFLAVCIASDVEPSQISVFGDDIIVPRADGPKVVANLEQLGFRVNKDKTFLDGDFVESCGVHCWRGVDLFPFQLKDDISDGPRAINIANKVRAYAWLSSHGNGCDRRYLHVWRLCLRWIPDELRVARGPYGYSGVLWTNYDEIQNLTYENQWMVNGKPGLAAAVYSTKEKRSCHPRLLQHRLRELPDTWDVYIPCYGSRAIEPSITKLKDPSKVTAKGNTVKVDVKTKVRLTYYPLSQGWVQPGCWLAPAP